MSLKANLTGNLAYQAHAKGDYAKAYALYESALRDGMNKPNLIDSYGVLLMSDGKFEESIEIFSRALKLQPTLSQRYTIRVHRAVANMKHGNIKTAKVALEDIHQKQEMQIIYETLGYLYVITDDEKARSFNEKAINMYPDNATILDNIGQYYISKKHPEIAKEFLLEAYELDTQKADVNYHLALVYEHEGDKRKALDFANQAGSCKINPLNDVQKEDIEVLITRMLN